MFVFRGPSINVGNVRNDLLGNVCKTVTLLDIVTQILRGERKENVDNKPYNLKVLFWFSSIRGRNAAANGAFQHTSLASNSSYNGTRGTKNCGPAPAKAKGHSSPYRMMA